MKPPYPALPRIPGLQHTSSPRGTNGIQHDQQTELHEDVVRRARLVLHVVRMGVRVMVVVGVVVEVGVAVVVGCVCI